MNSDTGQHSAIGQDLGVAAALSQAAACLLEQDTFDAQLHAALKVLGHTAGADRAFYQEFEPARWIQSEAGYVTWESSAMAPRDPSCEVDHALVRELDKRRMVWVTRLDQGLGSLGSSLLLRVASKTAGNGVMGLECDQPGHHWSPVAQQLLLGIGRMVNAAYEGQLRTNNLESARHHYRTLLDTIAEGVLLVSRDGRIRGWNASAERILGAPGPRLERKCLFEVCTEVLDADAAPMAADALPVYRSLETGRPCSGEIIGLENADGRFVWVSMSTRLLAPEASDCEVVVSFADITDQRIAEEELRYAAFYDTLTGLANRALFADRLDHAYTRTLRDNGNACAVLFMDLDRFKLVNDTLGHAMGDRLLRVVSQRLSTAIRRSDTLARMGGDEFTVLLEDFDQRAVVLDTAKRIQDVVGEPLQLGKETVYVNASIGIAFSDDNVAQAEDMLRNADIAMYRAKATGRNRSVEFDNSMHQQVVDEAAQDSAVRKAVQRQEFEPWYQPIIDVERETIESFEVLARWSHPGGKIFTPAKFLESAENSGLIEYIDQFMARAAARQLAQWREIQPNLSLNLNVSGRHLFSRSFRHLMGDLIDSNELPEGALRLEIVESTLMDDDVATARGMPWFAERGVPLVLDDFGTGYSSLSYLHRFPLWGLKIDRSFVRRGSAPQRNITQAIVALGKQLDMNVVAEGVETPRQYRWVQEMGCRYIQGYYYSRPLPATAASAYVRKFASTRKKARAKLQS